ncbi:hypothetical protein M0805_005828 [Coniferiporia weirii]|nr:hypothetical protein M0805_005828 [Coniferiporia weirii]
MATVQQRPFSRDYSGLVEQSVLAGCILVVCITSHELMKRKRRGKRRDHPLGSVESWQFGYLFQGRSWAKIPSPPHPQKWPLAWVKEVITFPESKLSELRGVDASLYCRFMRGCFWFTALHTFTTTAVLLPIHLRFSDSQQFSSKSMNRALISALVTTDSGLRLLWIHLTLMLWVTLTWIFTLVWISKGAFRYRAQAIEAAAEQARQEEQKKFSPHPHPQHPFHAMPPLDEEEKEERTNKGLRLRTVMVTNIPTRLRSEKELKEYFEYYMSRPLAKPSLGLTSSTQPGLVNKLVSSLVNRMRKFGFSSRPDNDDSSSTVEGQAQQGITPVIERVAIARKMSELASLLDRREEMLRRLETAHIKLARKALDAVKDAIDLRENGPSRTDRAVKRLSRVTSLHSRRTEKTSVETDIERGSTTLEDEIEPEDRDELLIRTLGPYVEEFGMRDGRLFLESTRKWLSHTVSGPCSPIKSRKSTEKGPEPLKPSLDTTSTARPTIWEALFSLPRSTLEPYQPLIYLSALFRGRAVPAIDYYTAKVNLLTALVVESRARAITDFEPVSTAFVTFAHPDDARRACKYLAVHPNNLLACLVSMAPDYEDLDWMRVMKQTYRAEILKDWVVDAGVWVFTISWVIPVSLLVALVNINNIATVIPGLMQFLNQHILIQELLQSLLPTLLSSLLMLLIPLILLLIAKKAHTINTLSALHDRILTRYHKFLVANILVFFCVGVSALESFFTSFKSSLDVVKVIGESFPSAGPFYVGWFIFTTAIHGGFELSLFGLPLIVYPSTKRQVTPRKRAVGIRPRTFNYYYWLPNHVLVVILALVFSVLNPLLMPFVLIYFSVESVVIKNQLLHVYAKNYEGNGSLILIRFGRYTLDGLILAQVIFLAFLGVVQKEIHVGLTAVMIAFTVLVKILFTRICRAKFETADIIEAHIVCGATPPPPPGPDQNGSRSSAVEGDSAGATTVAAGTSARFKTWRLPKGFKFTYNASPHRNRPAGEHKPIPFDDATHFTRLRSWDGTIRYPYGRTSDPGQMGSLPESQVALSDPDRPDLPPQNLTSPLGRPPLVTQHEKHPAWDDTARLNFPYDNPYFRRPVANHLWLPRDPVGILDLDDTVNVFRALTSEPSLGQLGEWIEGGIALSDLPSSLSLSDVSERSSLERVMSRELSGDEEIALPSVIAERVENIEKEDEVECAGEGRPSSLRRPSILTQRRTSSSGDARRRTFSQTRAGSVPRNRSSSFMSAHSFARQPSFFSQGSPPRRRSSFADPANQPDLYAQAPFAPSHVSFGIPPRPRLRTASNSTPVSTREAVVNEVIAEEYHATESRLREEAQSVVNSEGALSTRSWLTSWMFARVP